MNFRFSLAVQVATFPQATSPSELAWDQKV